VDQASGRKALPTAIRLTDERGRPLSIFEAHRHAKVGDRDDWRHSEELEAAVRSRSPARAEQFTAPLGDRRPGTLEG